MSQRVATVAVGLLICAGLLAPASAHERRPLRVRIAEQTGDTFLVQWIVSRALPPEALPTPTLPESCEAQGEPVSIDRRGVWLHRQEYRCPVGLSGGLLTIDWPVGNPSITTLVRLDLLSGRRIDGTLLPGEAEWSIPRSDEPADALLRRGAEALVEGVAHLFAGWLHLGLLAAFGLLSGTRRVVPSIGLFSAGQLVVVVVGSTAGLALPATLPEIGLALAVVLLSGAALRRLPPGRGLSAVAVTAGAIHGFALVDPAGDAAAGLLRVLGMDAAGLALAGLGWVVIRATGSTAVGDRRRRILALALGGIALVSLLALAVSASKAPAGTTREPRADIPAVADAAIPGARRVAPYNPDLPIRGFLDIEAHEVRHEVLLRLDAVADEAGLELSESLPIDRQPEVARALGRFVTLHTRIRIDGAIAEPIVDRVEFVSLTRDGALPRPAPMEESLAEAVVGLTLAYVTAETPDSVELTWDPFPDSVGTIQSTAIDPESSRSMILMPERPTLSWVNELVEDPAVATAAVAVEPWTLPLPLLALPLLVAALWLTIRAATGRDASISFAAARVTLALAILAAPWGDISVAVPGSPRSTPSEAGARRILSGLLPEVYRALELRDESAAYDRLAVAVSGTTLTEIYLEHRKALVLEERGGARARVEAVELLGVDRVEPEEDGGFRAEVDWTVGGTVTHFGHRHFRLNGYRARVIVVPELGRWKIRGIEVVEERRLR